MSSPEADISGAVLLVYINEVLDDIDCDARMFADYISLSSTVNDVNRSADELNRP